MYDDLNRLTTLIIRQGSEGVFTVPEVLSTRVDRDLTCGNALSCRSFSKDSGVDTCSGLSLNSCGKVAEDAGSAFPDYLIMKSFLCLEGGDEVKRKEEYLSRMYEQVRHMPDNNPIKRQVIKRINKSHSVPVLDQLKEPSAPSSFKRPVVSADSIALR